jgi:hypothetical protein
MALFFIFIYSFFIVYGQRTTVLCQDMPFYFRLIITLVDDVFFRDAPRGSVPGSGGRRSNRGTAPAELQQQGMMDVGGESHSFFYY